MGGHWEGAHHIPGFQDYENPNGKMLHFTQIFFSFPRYKLKYIKYLSLFCRLTNLIQSSKIISQICLDSTVHASSFRVYN